MTSHQMHRDMTASTELYPAVSTYWEKRRALAAQLRELELALLTHEVPLAEVEALTATLASFNQRHNTEPRIEGRLAWLQRGSFPNQDNVSVELSPLIGKSHGGNAPLRVWIENGEGRAEIQCDWRYEGPPKCVHGGYIAAIFDEFLGWAQMLSGGAGATNVLSITYHRPTPLNCPLLLKARLASVEGRKVRVQGEMFAHGQLTASADVLFISFGQQGTQELYKNL